MAVDLRKVSSLTVSVLVVDRELSLAAGLASDLVSARARADLDVVIEADFAKARAAIRVRSPHLLVTALQLGAYNGMHLVHIANTPTAQTRSVVHTDAVHVGHAREVRAAGAFYEVRSRLRFALPAYVAAMLPAEDRRDPIRFDRRRLARGGRRAADFRPSL